MTSSDWVVIGAIVLAPLLAVQVQKSLEVLREKRQRKMAVFQTLMGTRAARLLPAHVQALNMIDMEFYGRRVLRIHYPTRSEKAVLERWKAYLDHLNHLENPNDDEEFKNWFRTKEELFVDLLYEMARSLGYQFDRVHLKRGIYSPQAHDFVERQQREISANLAEILRGDKAIPMKMVSFPGLEDARDKQAALQTQVLEFLDGRRAVKVRLVAQEDGSS